MKHQETNSDLEPKLEKIRWMLSLLALTLLLAGLYSVLRPFIGALAWAVIIVTSTWPLYQRLCRVLPKYPSLSAGVMTLLLALFLFLLVVPLLVALVSEVTGGAQEFKDWLLSEQKHLAVWVEKIPFIGESLSNYLKSMSTATKKLKELILAYQSQLVSVASVAAQRLLEILFGFVVCIFSAFFLYKNGASLGEQVTRALTQIGGTRFASLLSDIRITLKGAVYGVIATAVVQGLLAGLGYMLAGAPVPLLLSLATMLMALIPFGTPLVYLPVSLIVVMNGAPWLHGILLAAWGVCVISMVDNVLRPIFISQAISMPLLLVFFSVVGGVLSFGLIGIFLGPVICAVAQALWHEWLSQRQPKSVEPV